MNQNVPHAAAGLPKLRQELQITPGRKNLDGKPTWLLYDPVQHRYIQIDETCFYVLTALQDASTVQQLAALVSMKLDQQIDPPEVEKFIQFAAAHSLLAEGAGTGWRDLAAKAEQKKAQWMQRLLHNYLFFKIPVFQPEQFLRLALPAVQVFFAKAFWIVTSAIGLAGLYFASRQWEAFWGTFQDFLSFEGFILFAATMFFVKALHELGHAFTALRLGCRVPTIGVAFMMLTPMLYTDVTDAWRLRARRQRLMIDSAGVMVELAIACYAIFFWAFLPEGNARSLAFLLATTSLIMSLAINLSPFMRFDGYYILSDVTGVDNLQPRAFEAGVWKLRKALLGLDDPSPEALSASKLNWLAVYAYATWIYRAFLFIGIALVVYHYFFKLVGILLFAFEILYFVAVPIKNEFSVWWRRRSEFAGNRRFQVSSAAAMLLFLGCAVPWSTRVKIPVVIEANGLQHIYPPRPAEIVAIHVELGDGVEKGQLLASLSSPELSREIAQTQMQARTLELRLARRAGDSTDRQQSIVLEGQLVSARTKLHGLKQLQKELEVRAPVAGTVLELNPELHPARSLSARELIASIGRPGEPVAKGYVSGTDLQRIKVGADGVFLANDLSVDDIPATLTHVAFSGSASIDIPELASTFGGKIPVTTDNTHRLVPNTAQYLITAKLNSASSPAQTQVGVLFINADAESLLLRGMRSIARNLIREAGL